VPNTNGVRRPREPTRTAPHAIAGPHFRICHKRDRFVARHDERERGVIAEAEDAHAPMVDTT